MAKARKTPQAGGASKAKKEIPPIKHKVLTWRHERFVEAYIDNNGNGSQAARRVYKGSSPAVCANRAARLLKKDDIIAAIEAKRESIRNSLNVTREDLLRVYIGMALARHSDFAKVLRDPESQKSYVGLGDFEYAIKGVKKSFTNGNEVTFVDRKAVLDELWSKLGFDKGASKGNWFDGFGPLAELIRGTEKKE